MSRHAFFVALIVALLASGCAGIGQTGVAALPAGSTQRGRALFSQATIRGTSGCVQCHSLARYKTIVGPSLWGVATRAGRIVQSPDYRSSATTAEQYLREAITRPGAYVTAGFSHSVMPDWLTVLDQQQIEDLVAYLTTLEE